MKKLNITLIMCISLSTTISYSEEKTTTNTQWKYFDTFTQKHAYKLSRDGLATSAAWIKGSIAAAKNDSDDKFEVAKHIANFIEIYAFDLLYEQNQNIYKETADEASLNARTEARTIAKYDKKWIIEIWDDIEPQQKQENNALTNVN